ncbi:hypothetical protein ABE142_14980 [Paenibacillus alvei]|uniref:hypothetical protein n=1 Tax=Paenibacillus alvei TaxID=44250 RepID=UPI003D2DCCD3
MFLKGKKIKVVFSLLTVICLMFGLSTSAFASYTFEGKYSFKAGGEHKIDIPFKLKNQPSINVTTTPETKSNANLLIYLYRESSTGNYVEVAAWRYNSGETQDTCALNPKSGFGGGKYYIVIKSADNSVPLKGSYSFTDWNNNN